MNEKKDMVQDVKRLDIKKIEDLLQSGSLESCDEILDSILSEVEYIRIKSLMIRLYVCMDIYVAAHTFARKIGISNDKFFGHFGTADEIGTELMTADDTLKFLHKIVRDCIMWRIESAKESSKGEGLHRQALYE